MCVGLFLLLSPNLILSYFRLFRHDIIHVHTNTVNYIFLPLPSGDFTSSFAWRTITFGKSILYCIFIQYVYICKVARVLMDTTDTLLIIHNPLSMTEPVLKGFTRQQRSWKKKDTFCLSFVPLKSRCRVRCIFIFDILKRFLHLMALRKWETYSLSYTCSRLLSSYFHMVTYWRFRAYSVHSNSGACSIYTFHFAW